MLLSQIKARVRDRADMKNSSFISDEELLFFINQSIKELHDVLTDPDDSEYYIDSFEFTAIPGTDTYDLPPNFYELKGVDVKFQNNKWSTIKKYNFNERNRFNEPSTWAYFNIPYIRYRLHGGQLRFNPAPDAALSLRMWYVPEAVELVLDTDEFVNVGGYVEYVIVDAAIKCKDKEESDVTVLMAQKAALLERISKKAQKRDVSNPESVSDVYSENDDEFFGS